VRRIAHPFFPSLLHVAVCFTTPTKKRIDKMAPRAYVYGDANKKPAERNYPLITFLQSAFEPLYCRLRLSARIVFVGSNDRPFCLQRQYCMNRAVI
jgi:hypothetical protein